MQLQCVTRSGMPVRKGGCSRVLSYCHHWCHRATKYGCTSGLMPFKHPDLMPAVQEAAAADITAISAVCLAATLVTDATYAISAFRGRSNNKSNIDRTRLPQTQHILGQGMACSFELESACSAQANCRTTPLPYLVPAMAHCTTAKGPHGPGHALHSVHSGLPKP